MTSISKFKQKVAEYVTKEVSDNHILMIGSGSTVNEVVKLLPSEVKLVSGSRSTSLIAFQTNHEVISLDSILSHPNKICIDGADEILQDFIIIKGHGGALLREKILWRAAQKIIVVVDDSKMSSSITKSIPVVISPFSPHSIIAKIRKFGEVDHAELSINNNLPFTTDDNMMIVHLTVQPNTDLRSLDKKLHQIAGVIETGIFLPENYENVVIYKASIDGIEQLIVNQSL